MTHKRGHRSIEHTADLALEFWAPTQEELLEEVAIALVEIMTEAALLTPRTTRTVALEALDHQDRLVQWANQVIWFATVEGFLVAAAELALGDGGWLHGRVRGEEEAWDRLKTELKSATYHDLALERQTDGWYARLVLDV